jgi:hypothetical protein
MKTNGITQKQSSRTLGFMGMIMVAMLTFSSTYGQQTNKTKTEVTSNERTVKGVIKDDNGPLKDVNIVQEDPKNGTVTNDKGEFTFPVKLKTGDILLVSYLGYETQKVIIKEDTVFIEIVLTEDLIEMIGSLDSGKPYKSKRKN